MDSSVQWANGLINWATPSPQGRPMSQSDFRSWTRTLKLVCFVFFCCPFLSQTYCFNGPCNLAPRNPYHNPTLENNSWSPCVDISTSLSETLPFHYLAGKGGTSRVCPPLLVCLLAMLMLWCMASLVVWPSGCSCSSVAGTSR